MVDEGHLSLVVAEAHGVGVVIALVAESDELVDDLLHAVALEGVHVQVLDRGVGSIIRGGDGGPEPVVAGVFAGHDAGVAEDVLAELVALVGELEEAGPVGGDGEVVGLEVVRVIPQAAQERTVTEHDVMLSVHLADGEEVLVENVAELFGAVERRLVEDVVDGLGKPLGNDVVRGKEAGVDVEDVGRVAGEGLCT